MNHSSRRPRMQHFPQTKNRPSALPEWPKEKHWCVVLNVCRIFKMQTFWVRKHMPRQEEHNDMQLYYILGALLDVRTEGTVWRNEICSGLAQREPILQRGRAVHLQV